MDTLECPCCGDAGAESDAGGLFYDGQDTTCGCGGWVSLCTETEPHIVLPDGEPCPVCADPEPDVTEAQEWHDYDPDC